MSFLLLLCGTAIASEPSTLLAQCAGIADNTQRLACFDRIAAGSSPGSTHATDQARAFPPSPAPSSDAVTTAEPVRNQAAEQFSLARHWEIGQQNKRGTFSFQSHKANYLLATYNPSPNNDPYQPFRALTTDDQGLSHAELAFQLGFKMKLMENAGYANADVWFAYTQQSFWQASNQAASSPFRESNYQPEFMLVVPVDFTILGMDARFINFGFVHQSNGQFSTLSRSWNRLYVQAGLENNHFSLLARAWKRINEDAADDDNPDISDYMGYGDVLGTYRINGHELSLLGRYSFHTDRGALQAGWAFPLANRLKGYIQLFSGYGQSLIDYNYAQKSIGLGVLVNY